LSFLARATAVNIQPWEFVVVTEPAVLRKIAELTDYGKFIAEAPVCVLVLCAERKYYLQDGSATTENILLAARAHGLGSCWVAGDAKHYNAGHMPVGGGAPRLQVGQLDSNWLSRGNTGTAEAASCRSAALGKVSSY
jgi:nitroreductase